MSALNVAVKKASVSVIADSAAYNSQGKLEAVVAKVLPLSGINAVVGVRGPAIAPKIFADLFSAVAENFDTLREMAPALVRDAWSSLHPIFDCCEFGPDLDVIVAGLSERDGPCAYLIPSHRKYGTEPWAAIELLELSLLPASPEIHRRVLETIPHDVEQLDERAAVAILEAQRACPVEHSGGRWLNSVGGYGELTTVTADGVSSKIICRWPEDEIGRTIGAADVLAAVDMVRAA